MRGNRKRFDSWELVRETDDCSVSKSLTSRILVPRIVILKSSKITAASTRGSEGREDTRERGRAAGGDRRSLGRRSNWKRKRGDMKNLIGEMDGTSGKE